MRPLHTVFKTLYHACLPLSLWVEGSSAQQRGVAVGAALARNIADIVRTPLYGLALTILAVVGCVFGGLGLERVYDVRALAGRVERSLNWGEPRAAGALAPCFQPLTEELSSWEERRHEDVDYTRVESAALVNLSRAVLRANPYLAFAAKSDEEGKGFVYRVMSRHGAPVYLIGSVHIGTKRMCENKKIVELIAGSRRLMTESVDSTVGRAAYWVRKHGLCHPFVYCMDREWVALADSLGIPHVLLESQSEQVQIGYRLHEASRDPTSGLSPRAQKTVQTPRGWLDYELVSAWLRGDVDDLERIAIETLNPEMKRVLLDERNQRWLDGGLLDAIANAREPISVVVGAAHLYGERGLLRSITAAGLTVESIYTNS
jgi:hypothetical protein